MVRIQNEHDLETLRQIALLQDSENKRLIERVTKLTVENLRLRGFEDTAQLELEIRRNLESARDEILRIDERQNKAKAAKPAPNREGHGPRPQPHLPMVERVLELSETEKKCLVCDGELGEMSGQYEESEVVTVVKRSFVIERQLRKKYRCRCNANVVTAPAAPKLQPGGRYSVEFGVEVAVSKYLDHLPLERQVRMMRREGLEIDSQTLWDQLNVLARHLEPVYDALGDKVLESPVVHADETRWPLMGAKHKKKAAGTVWGLSSPDIAYYRMLPTKSAEDGQKVLGNYRGIAVVDGYAVYEVLARAGPELRLAHCWAHVKRKFDEASEHYPQACSEVLELIGKLYEIERLVPGPFPGDEEAQTLRLRLRQERSRPLVNAIREWAMTQRGLPRSDFGKAVRYMLERWDKLTVFVDNPLVSPDNNHAERALRGPVVGRKNHYGSRSKRGTEVAALFYTLCETAKLQNVEPRAYLLKAAYAAIENPGTIVLPGDLLAKSAA
ncbi:MAG TPA: IS66 family transposase [Vicinamibacteria bacterium]|nr:IS66 family transposase [Vicinamibacteria bacterium]